VARDKIEPGNLGWTPKVLSATAEMRQPKRWQLRVLEARPVLLVGRAGSLHFRNGHVPVVSQELEVSVYLSEPHCLGVEYDVSAFM